MNLFSRTHKQPFHFSLIHGTLVFVSSSIEIYLLLRSISLQPHASENLPRRETLNSLTHLQKTTKSYRTDSTAEAPTNGILSHNFCCMGIVLYTLAEFVTGFCQTYAQFFATRTLCSMATGGIYGNSATIALEDAPITARGLLSGLLEQGRTLGCILVSALSHLIVSCCCLSCIFI